MKTANARDTRNSGLTAALFATAFVTALSAQGAFAMPTEHDLKACEAAEASESGVVIIRGAGPRGEAKYIRPDTKTEIVGYEIGGPVGRLMKNPAE